ncbi:MAG: 5'-methylthioadenosine/S-adenosylhomocysteine nucleosidase [Chloroflexota bacterium]|nr:MAG: 5'-methylthioadenosine/S-adenosylhomocysteine nucleosidase [Chloroflexota bacterium]
MRTLAVFPLQEELAFFLAHGKDRGLRWRESRLGRLPVYRSADLNLTLARGGIGKAQFAVQTQHLLDADPSWQMVICAGAAGALVDDLTIGDVVVATTTLEHDYRNRFSQRPLPAFAGARPALDALRLVRPADQAYAIHFGPVASGDEDIVDDDRRWQLRDQTGGLVAAWEGAGGARACAFAGIPFVEIRGVTDAADAIAPSAFEINLERAMANIADLITTWLERTQA